MPNRDEMPWTLTIPFASEREARDFAATSDAMHFTITIEAAAHLHALDPSSQLGHNEHARHALRAILDGSTNGEIGPISWQVYGEHWLRIRIGDYLRVASRQNPRDIAKAIGATKMLGEVIGTLTYPTLDLVD